MMFVVMLNEEQFPEVKVVSKSEQMSLCLTQKLLLPLLHWSAEVTFGADIEELMSQLLW